MKPKERKRAFVLLVFFLVLAAGIAALYVLSGTADIGAGAAGLAVADSHVSDTSAENAVTAVYLNYRFWDTLFESLILLVSVFAVRAMSWSSHRE